MLKNNYKQKGLTLIELMIAMILGIFVTAVIITVFSTTVRSNVENMKMIRLNQELRGAMSFMVDELKRAGYSADPNNDSFMSAFNASTASCILYSYDDDDGARKTTGTNQEEFGFRLDSNQIRWARDTADSCTFTGESITDANMAEITVLTFDISGSVNNQGVSGFAAVPPVSGVSVYDITITLTGTTDLPHSPDASRTITETIRVRNDAPTP
ncbi:MAG: type IV pilin [Cycloclasticus sp. symbiont of Bathymodiolus heckerae]|nr:MAG: type IV pilin [Cycloclasticus sp. symbiont of Bathymodiolus heckerae]